MEMPPDSASSDVLLEHGAFHLAALGADDGAAAMRDAFATVQDGLRTAQRATVGAREAAAGAEALRIAAEVRVETSLRKLELILLAGVNKRRKDEPYVSAFPEGVTGAIAPLGNGQVAEAKRILALLAPTAGEPPAGVPAEAGATLVELLRGATALEERVRNEDAAAEAEARAFSTELSLRRSWREQYRKGHGLLTAQYPTDRKRVDSFFKKASKSKAKKPAPPAS